MRITYKRHKLLNILYKQFNEDVDNRLSFDVLCNRFNIDYNELRLIKSELLNCKEVLHCELMNFSKKFPNVERTKTNKFGLMITDIGIEAVSNKKYLKKIQNSIRKLVFSVLIPLIAITISVISFIKTTNNTEESQLNIEAIEERLLQLEEAQHIVAKPLPNQLDSLNNSYDSIFKN